MKVSLTQKIYAGSFLLLTVIAGMVVILIHERGRMREIDSEVHDLQSVGIPEQGRPVIPA